MSSFLEQFSELTESLQSGPLAVLLAAPYLLVGLRFLGMLQTAPLFSSSVVSWRMRIILAAALAIALAPMVDPSSVSTQWESPETTTAVLLELAWSGVAELLLGALLGLGAGLVLSGLELAGTLIDQQSGLALSQVLNPVSGEASSVTGHLLMLLGGAVFLLLTPTGGDLLLVPRTAGIVRSAADRVTAQFGTRQSATCRIWSSRRFSWRCKWPHLYWRRCRYSLSR